MSKFDYYYNNCMKIVNEAFDDKMGATKEIDPHKLIEYINRIITRKKEEKNRKFSKTDKTARLKDYLHMPHIHSSVINRVLVKTNNGNTINLQDFSKIISTRPDKILKRNNKMVKSDTTTTKFFNTSLPALKGLVIDEDTDKFHIVDTCPSAGACQLVCYAKHGSYIMFPNASLAQNKTLNYLFNDSEGFKDQMIAEVELERIKNREKQIQIRWNDSGDLLSSKFFQIVMDIVNATPKVDHYIYTKEVKMVKEYPNPPDNVIFNFSYGARKDQEHLIDLKKDKVSHIVDIKDPKKEPILNTIKKFNYIEMEDGEWVYKNLSATKHIIAQRYDLNVNKILSIDELSKTPTGKPLEYNVIVLPGESDLSASRRDVAGTFLIIH